MGGGGSRKQTIGYKYYLGMHMGICHGPVNSITAIFVGERYAWVGSPTYTGQSKTTININAPNMFGGDKKEGGVQGAVDIMWGSPTQGTNAYLAQHLATPYLPAFRGIVSLVLNQCYVCAGAPYPKPWWVKVTRLPGSTNLGDPWRPELSEPTPGSANPVHIIRECFINTDWGLGYPTLQLDDASFAEVADTLNNEEFGLSYIVASQGPVEELIQEILKTINGVIYTNRETGRFVLKLVRDDYIVGNLPVFDEYNILEYTSFQRPQPAEMVNEVTIVYRRKEDFNDTSVTFQDLASIISQGAIISQKLEYPGIDDDNIASLVGMRELRQYSTPLAQVVFTANRQAWDLNPGDPFVFSWAERGISQLVMRALKINYGELKKGQIEITAVEDIFGLPAASYIEPQGSLWEDPVVDPQPIDPDDKTQLEAPYFLIATTLDAPDVSILTESSSYLIAFSSFPAFPSSNFELWTAVSPSTTYTAKVSGTYCYRLILQQDITKLDLDNEVPIDVVGFPESFLEDTALGKICLIGEGDTAELAIFSGYNETATTITLKRGALDTLPKEHSTGDYIWFFEDEWAFDTTEYSDGAQINLKLLPRTGLGVLDIDDANPSSQLMEGRQYRPSPPSYIRIYDQAVGPRFFPSSIRGDFLITWRRTNRITQTVINSPPYFYDGTNVTAEEGVVWNLIIYGEDLVTIVLNLDLTPTTVSYSWTTEAIDSGLVGRFNNKLRVILKAVRIEDAIRIDSHEELDLTIDRRGYTYNYDLYYNGGEG